MLPAPLPTASEPTTLFVAVSITDSVPGVFSPRRMLLTYRRVPSGEIATNCGRPPTWIVVVWNAVAVSTMPTVPSCALAT